MSALLILLFSILSGSAIAQSLDIKEGKDFYMYFCAECHGKDAASVGPIAEMLAISPPKLANLSKRNGGVFPYELVAKKVDGRIEVAKHRNMPFFGLTLDSERFVSFVLPDGRQFFVPQDLGNIIAYLQSVQTDMK